MLQASTAWVATLLKCNATMATQPTKASKLKLSTVALQVAWLAARPPFGATAFLIRGSGNPCDSK